MKLASWLVLCSLIILSFASALAQPGQTQTTAPATAQTQPHQQKVTEYHLPPDQMAKAIALYKIHTVLYVFGMVFSLVLLVVLLRLKVAPKYRDWAERISKNSFVQACAFVPLLILTINIISIPVDIYEHHISRAYGLSVQSWGSWLGDWAKGQMITLLMFTFLAWLLFLIIRRSPRRWWLYFWLLTLPLLVLLIFVAPILLAPMFNKFERLEKTQPQLVSEIEKVNHRGGLSIPRSKMFEMKASEKVTTYNAYVTGIGATKRVVVWDNTSRDMTVAETLFVFGHEQGHYVLNHIYKRLAFVSVMMLFAFWIGSKIVRKVLARWGEGWHIRELGDYAALPVLMLALSLVTLVTTPIGSTYTRHIEHQADIYGLEVTHGLFADSGQVAASSFQKLGEKSYEYPTPNPVLVFWAFSHPTIADRINFSLTYDPWHGGAEPKYVK